jgi:membrane glycosyltransferase
VRNPVRSEPEAFRFLVGVIVAAVVIVAAAYVNTWLGVAVAALALAFLVWWLLSDATAAAAAKPSLVLVPETPTEAHRVLVVAKPGTSSVSLGGDVTEVVVVVPALASTVEALTGAVDDRRAKAEQTARRLASQLPNARGEVGADDPVLATEDALRRFGADEIVVAGDEAMAREIRSRVRVPVGRA